VKGRQLRPLGSRHTPGLVAPELFESTFGLLTNA